MHAFLRYFSVLAVSACLLIGCVSRKQYDDLVARLEAREVMLADDDGDGVLNQFDLEPDTPPGAPVDTRGVVLDSDADGIADYQDMEPYSPPGSFVDIRGVAEVSRAGALTEEDVNRLISSRMASAPTSSAGSGADLNALNFPVLNIPPPPTRKMQQFPVGRMFPGARTYGDVNAALSELLDQAGFRLPGEDQPRYSYFQIKDAGQFGGFAVVTDFEQTTEQGVPFKDRFNLAVNRAEYTSIWERLFLAPLGKGYFRLFAFLVADEYYGQPGQRLSRAAMQERLTVGARRLHPAISETEVSPEARLHVLVYEFKQLESDADGRPIDLEGMNVGKHLRAAGLSSLLK